MVAELGQIVGQLLDPRLVGDGRKRVRGAGGRLGGILAAGSVDAVALLGQRGIGLERVVADRQAGRCRWWRPR